MNPFPAIDFQGVNQYPESLNYAFQNVLRTLLVDMRTYASMASMLLQDHRFARVCYKTPDMDVCNLVSLYCSDMCFVDHLDIVFSPASLEYIWQGWLLGSYPPVETGSRLSFAATLWEARQWRLWALRHPRWRHVDTFASWREFMNLISQCLI